jgi:hypothetical protein
MLMLINASPKTTGGGKAPRLSPPTNPPRNTRPRGEADFFFAAKIGQAHKPE